MKASATRVLVLVSLLLLPGPSGFAEQIQSPLCDTEEGQVQLINEYLEQNVGPMTARSLSKEGYAETLKEVCPLLGKAKRANETAKRNKGVVTTSPGH